MNLKVTTDINKNSTGGNTVDIDATSSVTLTAQLVDGDGEPVARSGVKIEIEVVQGNKTLYPAPAAMKTDADGMVTYTTSGPKSTKGNTDKDRVDMVTFKSDVNGDGTTDALNDSAPGDPAERVRSTIVWTDSDPTLATGAATTDEQDNSRPAPVGSGKGSTDPYALRNSKNEVSIRASVMFYDQYGNPAGRGNSVGITIGTADLARRTISSSGTASWRATVTVATLDGSDIAVTYTALQDSTGNPLSSPPTITGGAAVVAVEHAPDDSSADAATLNAVYADENRFRVLGLLYTYDDGDTFVNDAGTEADGELVDIDKFEKLITQSEGGSAASVEVVAYDDDGRSIFRVVTAAS